MRKLGKGLLDSIRRVKRRRVFRQPSRADLCRREVGTSKQQLEERSCDWDEEAPSLSRRFLQPETSHFATAGEDSPMFSASPIFQHPYSNREICHKYSQLDIADKSEAILKARDRHWQEKARHAKETGEDFDEEQVLTAYAKDALLKADSAADLVLAAELLIEEDWLGKVDTLPGNIYRLAVIGDVFLQIGEGDVATNAQTIAKMLGVLTIILIQIVGPPLVFLSRIEGVGVLNDDGYKWECCPWHPYYDPAANVTCFFHDTMAKDVSYFDDWYHIGTTKALGILMMFAFIMNGLFVLLDERRSWKQIYNTFRYLDIMNPRFKLSGISFLYLDGIINTWVIFWCCIDVFLVVGPSESPTDVLMDALGLVFLYNLDDVGGDLGFISNDDWPGLRLAWIYKEIVHPCPDEIFDEDKLDMEGCIICAVYFLAAGVLALLTFIIPIVAALTPFIQIVP